MTLLTTLCLYLFWVAESRGDSGSKKMERDYNAGWGGWGLKGFLPLGRLLRIADEEEGEGRGGGVGGEAEGEDIAVMARQTVQPCRGAETAT